MDRGFVISFAAALSIVALGTAGTSINGGLSGGFEIISVVIDGLVPLALVVALTLNRPLRVRGSSLLVASPLLPGILPARSLPLEEVRILEVIASEAATRGLPRYPGELLLTLEWKGRRYLSHIANSPAGRLTLERIGYDAAGSAP